jgi:hypothetical protein
MFYKAKHVFLNKNLYQSHMQINPKKIWYNLDETIQNEHRFTQVAQILYLLLKKIFF